MHIVRQGFRWLGRVVLVGERRTLISRSRIGRASRSSVRVSRPGRALALERLFPILELSASLLLGQIDRPGLAKAGAEWGYRAAATQSASAFCDANHNSRDDLRRIGETTTIVDRFSA
jgi:hypothetical protein